MQECANLIFGPPRRVDIPLQNVCAQCRVQSAESSPAAAWSDRVHRHRQASCRQVRRKSARQRPQRSPFHPRADAERSRPLRRRQRTQRLDSPG